MVLRTETNVKVNGDFLKGTIVNGNYKTNSLVDLSKYVKNKELNASLDISKLTSIRDELNELIGIMEGMNVADTLSDDTDQSDVMWR